MKDKSTASHSSPYARQVFATLANHQLDICEDLKFLVYIAITLEQRSAHWHGRVVRSLDLAITMNECAGQILDTEQLIAAILVHDFAMGFLPSAILHKTSPLSAKEHRLMRTHISSAAELLNRMQQWPQAKEMILAHHEHVDGTGYPNQLLDLEIPEGAKVIAIVDAFTAQGDRKIMHGVMEINRHAGTHFSPIWIEHFGNAIKRIYQSDK